MADARSTIQLIFEGIDQASDVADRVGGKISGALSDISKAGDALEGIATPIAAVADKILETETAITGLGLTMVGVGVNAAGKFNDAFAFTSTLFDATGPQLAKFKDEILAYASGSTQSLDQINAALQNAIGQGIDYADSLGLLATSEKLAVAQGAQLGDSTSLLASTMNAYKLTIADAAKLSDVFSIAVRDGKISVAEMAAQLSNVTPLAASAGIGIDQIGAAVAVLTSQGFKAEASITGVRNILEGLIKPTGQAADYAASLGLKFDATTLKSRGLDGVLQDVQKATNGNVDSFAKLFTTSEGLTSALALAGPGAATLTKELQAMREESGVTDAAFAKMAGNVALGGQRIENALETAFIALGTPLLDELGTIQKGIADVFAGIGKEFDDGGALRPITAELEAMGADIGATIGAIAKNLPDAFRNVDVSGLIDSYKALGQEVAGLFKSFFGDIDLSTVDGLSVAIQRVINTIETLTRTSAGIVGAFKPLAKAAGEMVGSFGSLDTASKVDFGEFLGAMRSIILAGPQIATALLLIGKSGIEMGKVINGVFGGVQVVVNAFQVAFDGVAYVVAKVATAVGTAFLSIAELAEFMNRDADNAGEYRQRVNDIKDSLSRLGDISGAIGENFNRNATELKEGWNRAIGETNTRNEELAATLKSTQAAIDDFKNKTLEAGEANRESVKAYDGILATLNKVNPAASSAVQAISELGDAQKKLIVPGDSAFLDEPIKNLKKTWDADGNPVYKAIGGATIKATNQFKAVGDSAADQAKKVAEATKAANDYKIKMEEIASNERIKTIEAVVSLKTEQLKADVERVKATFASIDTTIKSTGDLLGSLFGNLVGTDDPFKATKIESQIALENERRQKALDIQKELAEAEIERIQAQTRAMDRGDAIIKIDGTGLEPELEAFMWQILKKIRVRANADYSDYLLGISTT